MGVKEKEASLRNLESDFIKRGGHCGKDGRVGPSFEERKIIRLLYPFMVWWDIPHQMI